MKQRNYLFLVLLLVPVLAQAWWNDDWSYRKAISIDTGPGGANLPVEVDDVPVLIRLHTGNFSYFLDMADDARDLRFMSEDDQTPLKFHIEKFDPINEMALVWVGASKLLPGSDANRLWMYYGNKGAVPAEDPAGTYDANQSLVYHFGKKEAVPQDSTAYGNQAASSTAEIVSDALIGDGLRFNGEQQLRIADKPSLQADPSKGWTAGFWFHVDRMPTGARVLFSRTSEAGALALELTPTGLVAQLVAGANTAESRPVSFVPGSWHHVALVLKRDTLQIFLDGVPVQHLPVTMPLLAGDILLGMKDASSQGFVGDIDELEISSVARSEAWLASLVKSQSPGSGMVVYGEDADQGGGDGDESYFMTTLRNVTLDGWVVIVMLAIMAAISWMVMINKGLVINRIRKDNRSFEAHFAKLGSGHVEDLDGEESDEFRELDESPLMMALVGKHDHFQSSTLYPIYHAGVQEVHHRMAKSVGARAARTTLSPQAIDAIKATMDSVMTRQGQKLNSQMVLLTIAISGGPFLGLLGTVVGVMITFAAIAASGDVNVNSIAPGIAASLVATVAGLAVAIPALFAYNYLGTRIKEVFSDMRVFSDEFIAKIAEDYS